MKLHYIIVLCFIIPLLIASGASALTPDGSTPAGDNMNIFITLLFIVGTLALFFILFIVIAKLALGEVTIYDVLISWSAYILIIIVNHLTAHYVEDVFMYNLTNTFLTITVWTNGLLPLIAFIISFFIKSMQKKKPLSVQEVSGRLLLNG